MTVNSYAVIYSCIINDLFPVTPPPKADRESFPQKDSGDSGQAGTGSAGMTKRMALLLHLSIIHRHEGKININRSEIDEIEYRDIEFIKKNIGTSMFSDHFESEISHYLRFQQT